MERIDELSGLLFPVVDTGVFRLVEVVSCVYIVVVVTNWEWGYGACAVETVYANIVQMIS
jgi:hypothetical protein